MASGYSVNGVDLDSIFMPIGGATPGTATGKYFRHGVDLSDRFYPSSGGDQIAYDTGYAVNGTDLRYYFRDIAYVPPDPPVITGGTVTGGPYNYTVGDVANFDVTATGDDLTYQWYKDGSLISGATSSSYNLGATTHPSQSGTYKVIVTNGAGSDEDEAILTVADIAPTITGGTVFTGGPYFLSSGDVVNWFVEATGTNLTYQWSFNGSPVSGKTAASYGSFVGAPSDSGTYSVVVTNGAGTDSASEDITIT